MTDEQIVDALIKLLVDAGVGVYRPDGPAYTADEVAIYYGAIGSSPDSGIGLTLYHSDPSDLRNGLRGDPRVQLRFRGKAGQRRSADAIAQDAYDTLDGLTRTAGFLLVWRVLMAQLGTDGNRRPERADSYQINLDLPEA